MTKDDHFKSVLELVDAGINVVRSHQFLMLPGAEASNRQTREKYGLQARFRITPETFDDYRLYEKSFFSPEIDEVCVGSNMMSFEEYVECRTLDLTVEIFYNNGIFKELFKFLKSNDILASSIILKAHEQARRPGSLLEPVYEGFVLETQELFSTRKEAEIHIGQPGIIEQYRSGKLGNNEQLVYRALPLFNFMSELHQMIFDIALEILENQRSLNEQGRDYLGELREFSLLRKRDLFLTDLTEKKLFHYDFVKLEENNFNIDDPLSVYTSDGFNLEIAHTSSQKEHISKTLKLHGDSKNGLATILSAGTHVNAFFREVKKV